ncbi:phosphotransferase family protein [Salirhabdus salicampi]|uniref:phosphotransferase family protein n=1 Tax=Salirhabdus salicampi TaxID=476102 RepID=UPI0020C1D7DF|nr:phosphotransferase family protein [Salirhabdus salicampi]MCP8617162.1 phosphotransferase family protein [Salirhabdus salicampi]
MDYILGKEWTITPAGGSSGDAYFAEREGKRLFLKRNSSPFLAVLSAEGIVPKLVWTKRMENGDVITAQHWMEGRVLLPDEMEEERVALMLSKIHRSTELLHLFMRIGKRALEPEDMLSSIKQMYNEKKALKNRTIGLAIHYLHEQLPFVRNQEKVVCHGDMTHRNWLLTNHNQLYLIDWDQAIVADPAIDIGMLLYEYIPEEEWDFWLSKYGLTLNHQLMNRIYWYIITQSLFYINWHAERNELQGIRKWNDKLEHFLHKIGYDYPEVQMMK